ncbi:hypothetical protein M3894_002951 [Vibrio metschnikovii]|nr:hypothetical protein [Vibrio metschnikovii]
MKSHLKSALLIACSVTVLGCTTPLSREAQEITTISDGAVIAMMNCKELGFVTGSSGVWGGSAGLSAAYSDARNQAALLSGANAIMITSSRMNPTSIVNAKVYDCSDRKLSNSERINKRTQTPPVVEDINITIEQARKCQAKGGAWLNNLCVVSIE